MDRLRRALRRPGRAQGLGQGLVRVPDGQGGRRSETRTFRTTTAGLVLLGDWLASHPVTVVGMESTGVLLEAGLGPAGRRRRVLAAERPAPQEPARA